MEYKEYKEQMSMKEHEEDAQIHPFAKEGCVHFPHRIVPACVPPVHSGTASTPKTTTVFSGMKNPNTRMYTPI